MVNDGTSRYRQNEAGHTPRSADARPAAEDPLAELARLMSQEDEFAALMREAPRPAPRPAAPRPAPSARPPVGEGGSRPAPGSFAALAAEVYTEAAPRSAPPRPRSESIPGEAYARPAAPSPRAEPPLMPPVRPGAPTSAPRAPMAPPPVAPRAPSPGMRPDLAGGSFDPRSPAPAPSFGEPAQAARAAAAPPPGWMSRSQPAPPSEPEFALNLDDGNYDYGRSSGDSEDYGTQAEDDFDEEAEAHVRRSRRKLLIVGVAIAGVVLGAGGIFAYRSMSGGSVTASGQPPVIRADQSPSKVVPAQPAASDQASDGQKLIYDRVGGNSTGNERVVSSEEQPVDMSQAAQPQPRVIQPGGGASPTPVSPTTGAAPEGAEPKKVRTLTVRADGSIVEGAPAPATVPAAGAVAGSSASAPVPLAPSAPAASTGLSSTTAANVPAPPARLSAAPAAAPVTPTTGSVPSAGAYVVQIASVPSEADGQAALRNAQSRFASLLGGQPSIVRRADLSSGGVTYRVQIGSFAARAEAVNLCEALKAQGGSCIVQRP